MSWAYFAILHTSAPFFKQIFSYCAPVPRRGTKDWNDHREDVQELILLGNGQGHQDPVQIQGEGRGPPKLEGWGLRDIFLAEIISYELGGGAESYLQQQQSVQEVSEIRV